MTPTPLFASIRSWYSLAIFGVIAVALAGCGDTGLSSAGYESGSGTIVSGVGVGGTGVVRASQPAPVIGATGLVGAIVFLDMNANQQADLDEPFAYTDQDGSYSLQADPAAYPLLLQAIAGATIDKATGKPVSEGFVVLLVH